MKKSFVRAAMAASLALLGATAAQAGEVLSVPFTQPDGAISTGLYTGLLNITVAGSGQSLGITQNDAFYLFGGGRDGTFYQLNFGTSTLPGYNGSNFAAMEAANIDNYIVGGLPAYNPSHVYSFMLNLGNIAPTQLHFGVSDGVYSDNQGAYRISIGTAAVPEPSTWALLIAGFGMVGFAMRRRRQPVRAAIA